MDNALLPRFGGPMGRHAKPRGLWFNPLPWAMLAATLTFLVLFLRHLPCLQTDADNAINSYIRLCYSDIQSSFLGQEFALGTPALGGEQMLFSPLVAVAITMATQASRLMGSVGPGQTLQQQIDTSTAFFGWTALGLFLCFLVTAASFAWLGRRGDGRSWDSLLIAGSPIVLAAGLISWELLPLALTALGLVQFARRRLFEAGIVLGLAASAGTMPIAIILAVLVAAGLRGGAVTALKFFLPAVVTVVGVHAPLLLDDVGAVYGYYHQEINKEAGYGSLWYLFSLGGWETRHTGSLAFAILMLVLGLLVAYLYTARKRPRVGSLIAVIVLLTVLLGPAYPPQTSLWVLLAVMLARPYKVELIAVTVTEVGYYLAIWGWLAGSLTSAQQGPYGLYWLAIILRASIQGLVAWEALSDIVRPGRDELRTPDQPDPIGGVLNDDEFAAHVGSEDSPQDAEPVAATTGAELS
ncbi:glycosyltransferase family 87 protein [Tessaracoccus flavus]|nr:glycosyltransferase 87 family protein [Tessaracoccus flavus]